MIDPIIRDTVDATVRHLQAPVAWCFVQNGYTHYTDDKRDWYDAVGIEEVTPLYAAPVVQPPCLWSCDDDENMPGTWDGACGAKWTFTEDGPIENDLRYCPNCGNPVILEVIAAAENRK